MSNERAAARLTLNPYELAHCDQNQGHNPRAYFGQRLGEMQGGGESSSGYKQRSGRDDRDVQELSREAAWWGLEQQGATTRLGTAGSETHAERYLTLRRAQTRPTPSTMWLHTER